RGAQTLYSHIIVDDKREARVNQDELMKSLVNTDLHDKIRQNVYLIKHDNKPGAVVESGILSNPTERAWLKQGDYQEKMAVGIYRGIMRYFTNEKTLED
ncbi:N-acetylmuramoyl-L-alanine amidase CwlD, partial [Bacillus obstructivus]